MTDPAPFLDPGPIVLIDTKEQQPWEPFVLIRGTRWNLRTHRMHLGTGDYAVAGLEKFARVERKASDLYSTFFGGKGDSVGDNRSAQDRFREELLRMRDPAVLHPDAFKAIWIEGTPADLFYARGPHMNCFGRKQPWELWAVLASVSLDYRVPFAFVGDRKAAGLMLGTLAHRMWLQATDAKAIAKAEKRGVADLLPWLPPDLPDAPEAP